MKKYYVYRVSKHTGRKEYKKCKTLDNYVSEALKGVCWKYSKQGAQQIAARKNEREAWHFEYGIEETND